MWAQSCKHFERMYTICYNFDINFSDTSISPIPNWFHRPPPPPPKKSKRYLVWNVKRVFTHFNFCRGEGTIPLPVSVQFAPPRYRTKKGERTHHRPVKHDGISFSLAKKKKRRKHRKKRGIYVDKRVTTMPWPLHYIRDSSEGRAVRTIRQREKNADEKPCLEASTRRIFRRRKFSIRC